MTGKHDKLPLVFNGDFGERRERLLTVLSSENYDRDGIDSPRRKSRVHWTTDIYARGAIKYATQHQDRLNYGNSHKRKKTIV